MQTAITIPLVINILVLVPVCAGLLTGADWTGPAYGEPSAGRSILLSVYMSIALISALLLVIREPKMVMALLLVQVIYKLTTPFTVGTMSNPVVVSNILIALVHSIMLAVIWRSTS